MDLILATLLLCGSGVSTAQESPGKRALVNLKVYVIYDQQLHHEIIHAQTFQTLSRKGPGDYFAALLKGVELRFFDLNDYDIKLTLMKFHKRMDLGVPTNSTYWNALDGTKTMEELRLDQTKNSHLYTEGEIVVFVTAKDIITAVGDRGQWLGVAERGQVCQRGVALVSDNGKTFSGTDEVALQVALLLNASRDTIDNNCSKSEQFLLSSVYGGFHPTLSECSKKDMITFLQNTKPNCWTDKVVDLYNGKSPALYHNITGYDICTVNYNDNRDMKTCKGKYAEPKRNTTCRVECCDYFRLPQPFLYLQPAADGTRCGEGKVCVKRKCVDTASHIYSL